LADHRTRTEYGSRERQSKHFFRNHIVKCLLLGGKYFAQIQGIKTFNAGHKEPQSHAKLDVERSAKREPGLPFPNQRLHP
jgi:hypothetical protein